MSETMRCPSCGGLNPAEAEWCGQCLKRLAPSPPLPKPDVQPPSRLEADLERWIEEKLISRAQAEAIKAREAAVASAPEAGSSEGSDVPIVEEALGYVGGTFALSAAFVLIGGELENLTRGPKALFIGALAAAFGLSGHVLGGKGSPPVRRLRSYLWFLSATGVAVCAGLAADTGSGSDGTESSLIVAGAALTSYALLLWRLSPSPLQLIALYAGVMILVLALLADIQWILYGWATWLQGAAWLLLASLGTVRPQRTAVALGSFGALAGAQLLAFEDEAGLLLGLVSSIVLLLGVPLQSLAARGFGIGGLFLFVPQSLAEFFGASLGGPLVLFLGGVALAAGAVLVARRRTSDQSA